MQLNIISKLYLLFGGILLEKELKTRPIVYNLLPTLPKSWRQFYGRDLSYFYTFCGCKVVTGGPSSLAVVVMNLKQNSSTVRRHNYSAIKCPNCPFQTCTGSHYSFIFHPFLINQSVCIRQIFLEVRACVSLYSVVLVQSFAISHASNNMVSLNFHATPVHYPRPERPF